MDFKFDGKSTKVQQLAEFIQDAIAANELKVGEKIPSINHLSRQFSVSRDTVFKSLSDLRLRGVIDAIHGKNYYVASHTKSILLLLDEYSPFKEVLHTILVSKLPKSYKIDLWFHQYNEHLFNNIIHESIGKYNKYLVMNYDNEKFSDALSKIDKKKLLLLDFGKFDKKGYSYVCQDFDNGLYDALSSIRDELRKFKKLFFVLNKKHKHPQSSKTAFSNFCLDNKFEFGILDEILEKSVIQEGFFYLVIKQEDVVKIVKQGQSEGLKPGKNYGLLAYNENPFFEVIENGISSIGIDWHEMGKIAAQFVLDNQTIQTYLPTVIKKRDSF
ncbi:GntR family transcriptional regulator [Proteiniphilum sp. UBA1028]|jgi:DNA-binding transcriptional regulator YhcF (GntR family)|uniref:GntR family transcriptional regulator n=1 Tax=Proteiniphilum sp. UBA1028 TaxID=1947251 RepID=UPI000E94EFC8|nr:GntR family transcriptional regulator [Proteiniphilum sp. UBA1028]HBG58803.1 GntR family transcriptional regulator [Porphyromonadaceae bacterium]